MGYIKHHGMVVTCWDKAGLTRALDHAVAIGLLVTPIMESGMNGYCTFFVAPDGSKEGWAESDQGDRRRDQLIAFLESERGKNKFWPDWIEISYAGDSLDDNAITRHWAQKTEEVEQ